MSHDLLRVLTVASWGCGVVILAMAGRLALARAGAMPGWRGPLTLRHPLAGELSDEVHASNRRFTRLMPALVAVLGIGALLFWLDTVFFPVAIN
ncbi:hypothetical protein TSA1_10745 [Bradyrhizobium nitroreducens]|uniref:Uncharacterized protein n=1 Tax=Bradyrhizobium nitroreducens TaxID=709803 RepID=A0A2M6U9C2_9BRAD|nr:hypothetical protein TSA1_10745 [Bradyrhizobium nitroreducens]